MATNPKFPLTFEEYLALERNAEIKSEFIDGELFQMAGGSPDHNRIARNVLSEIHIQTRTGECEVFGSDQRIKIEKLEKACYPDISIVCGEQLFDERKDSLLNPTVIIEVLSDSTEVYDRGKKFQDYQLLDSLVEYLLIAQKPYCIEQFIKQAENIWTYRKFTLDEDVVQLESVGCALTLKDVYIKVA